MASVSLITTAYRASQADASPPADADVAELAVAEERGAYRVNGANGATPTSVPAPMVRFTQIRNEYLDDAMYALSGAGWKVLCYLLRHSAGYQRSEARLSIAEFCDGTCRRDGSPCDRGTGLSRRAVVEALRELQAAHIVTSDAAERGRTQVRTYHIEPPEAWTLRDAPTPTSAKSSLVGNANKTSAKKSLVDTQASAESSLVGPQTRLLSAPLINKEKKERSSKKDQTVTHVTGATDAPHDGLLIAGNAEAAETTKETTDGGGASAAHTPRTAASRRGSAPNPPVPPRPPSPTPLPLKQADEGELAYWQRVLKEANGRERVAILVHMARDKLAVLPNDRTYPRMGKLTREAGGAGVMAKHILQATAQHIDGDDPMDYLTKIVHRQTRATEGGNGDNGTQRRSQPPRQPDPTNHGQYAHLVQRG